MLVEGCKLTTESVLSNPLRAQMYQHITQNPGSRVRDIRKAMDIDSAESKWHLQVLEKFGFIRSKHFGKYHCFYPATLPETYDEVLSVLRQETAYKVFYDAFLTPNSSAQEISDRLELNNAATAKYHADKLVGLQLFIPASDPETGQERFSVNTTMWVEIVQFSPGFAN
jgi:predicted transcriptional regulator